MLTPMLTLLFVLACSPGEPTSPEDTSSEGATGGPRCGNGVVDPDEGCDEGAANSDTAPDTCRSDCLPARCGDSVVDAGETCDDGNGFGGDGCDGACAVEAGVLELEPNDAPAEATSTGTGVTVHGSLPSADTDCFAFDVATCGAVAVEQVGPCGAALTLSLHDPSGAEVATGTPGADGCAALDPVDQPGARWVAGGTWAVCATAIHDGELGSYALSIATPSPSTLDAPTGDDLDGDGTPSSCDNDRDGDGVLDVDDNCPDVSNGPDTTLALDASGYVHSWLASGPFTGDGSTSACRPSETARVGEDASEFSPRVGDPAGDPARDSVLWQPFLPSSGIFDLTVPYAYVDAPREAYAIVWLQSATARSATLAVGADDGVFAWWNDTQVLDVSGCQGVNLDQFQAPVEVRAGWNRLLVKVRDQGGGWGVSARLLDGSGAGLTDLTPAVEEGGGWAPDQTDSDGDNVGDVCDRPLRSP
jgi:cysteine-rich repeat protein